MTKFQEIILNYGIISSKQLLIIADLIQSDPKAPKDTVTAILEAIDVVDREADEFTEAVVMHLKSSNEVPDGYH